MGNNKIIWVLVVLLTNFFGAVLYFLIGKEQKIKK
ncbi:PLD nuclease N-terminal domain-containing protein [Tenacibaculum sp.]